MNRQCSTFSEKDLSFLVDVLAPNHKNKDRMIKTLREDEDILEGMLSDEKLFNYLVHNPETIINASPLLFFTVLLNRVKQDLEHRAYTVEQQERYSAVVFDSQKVVEFLEKKNLRNYLSDMLVSFVKINSYSLLVQVRKGVWRRLKFNDFDIDSLIKYSQMIDPEQRFPSYKRIADICLFITGIFPDYIDSRHRYLFGALKRLELIARRSREEFTKYGKYFYKAAAQQPIAQIQELNQVLLNLSNNFNLAVKPLTFMSSQYLGWYKDKFFLH
ncbi:MAG: hypothetical protein ACOC7U_02895 [Spirochaetota bacterium]